MNDDGVATGRFLPGYASFMPLRSAVGTFPSPPPRLNLAEDTVDSVSDVDPKLLRWDTQIGFVMQWHLPEVTWRHAYAKDGDTGLQLEAPDGSGAHRFGITAAPTEQYVWYDQPDGPHRWSLPITKAQPRQ